MPRTPADFNNTFLDRGLFNYSAAYEWDPSPRSGVESIVENYSLVITFNQENRSYITSSPSFVDAFEYYAEYSIFITAINCAGRSTAFVSTIQHGKLYTSAVSTFTV